MPSESESENGRTRVEAAESGAFVARALVVFLVFGTPFGPPFGGVFCLDKG